MGRAVTSSEAGAISASRRQWGSDRRKAPIPSAEGHVSERRITFGRLTVVATVLAWCAYFWSWLVGEFIDGGAETSRTRAEAFVYLLVVSLLTASALSYLVCRLGYLYRARDHRRLPRAVIDEFFSESTPTLTTIVPSYREEARVVRTTLLSAALQEYPYLRVVLLVDDPPVPRTRGQRDLLEAARALPGEVQALLDGPCREFTAELTDFERREGEPAQQDMARLAEVYDRAVAWLEAQAAATEVVDHADRFFVDQVLLGLAADFATTAAALRSAAASGVVLPRYRLLELYRRLAWTFQVEMSSFERKLYASLSSEPNKAMNLNSYIGLMGGTYRDVLTVSGRLLLPCSPAECDLEVPDPDYVLTLDADSILLPEYCLRLVHLLEQSQHARMAVAQTPYSAYPGAASRLERVAGATTDLQHIVHQGLTHYDATFWVGANAVLRKRALDEVCERSYAGNWEIRRYIQDRTVIEDTESTIDLGSHGWSLYNYPERLSYSATPPDFGALCIQRRRWANGGLLILPKLRRQLRARKARGQRARFGEAFLRTNYMASICWSSISLVLLLAYPFHNNLVSPLLGLVALPYFVATAVDLKACGYKRLDVLRVYGFNLMLVVVNLAGVGNSLVQAITGDKSVFGRTPKVRNRTVPSLMFVVAPYLVLGLAAYTLVRDAHAHRWVNGVYAGLNTVLTAYAIVAFVGIRNSLSDMWAQCKARLYKPVKVKAAPARLPAEILAAPDQADWAAVLHFGTSGGTRAGATHPPLTAPRTRPASQAVSTRAAASGHPEVAFRTVFQPILRFSDESPVGYEALTRFEDGVAPDLWLADAARRGAGVELETLLARAAAEAARDLPEEAWLAVNASLELARAGELVASLRQQAGRLLVLEIETRSLLGRAVGFLAEPGPGVAVSLAGAAPGYDSLALVHETRPAYAKLSRRWVSGIDRDRPRESLVRSLATVAAEVGCTLIAEGIETAEELQTLRRLGVEYGQGYYIGRPRDIAAAWR